MYYYRHIPLTALYETSVAVQSTELLLNRPIGVNIQNVIGEMSTPYTGISLI